MKSNPQYEAMLLPARERLKKYSIDEICRKGGLTYDKEHSSFLLRSLNQDIHISYPDFVAAEDLEMWHHLTLLQYMDTADGTPLTGSWIGLTQMHGGLARGHSFDVEVSKRAALDFSSTDSATFMKACLALGGEILTDSAHKKADVSSIIYYAPRFPVLVNFWEADDEFPASCKTLLDAHAEHYLTIEAAGGVCSTIISTLSPLISHIQKKEP